MARNERVSSSWRVPTRCPWLARSDGCNRRTDKADGYPAQHDSTVYCAPRAAKLLQLTRALKRLGALCFSAEVVQKVRRRHAILEVYLLTGHQDSHFQESSDYGLSGSLDKPAEANF
jgi:hypothetical protein